jgi:hypothetical protein
MYREVKSDMPESYKGKWPQRTCLLRGLVDDGTMFICGSNGPIRLAWRRSGVGTDMLCAADATGQSTR